MVAPARKEVSKKLAAGSSKSSSARVVTAGTTAGDKPTGKNAVSVAAVKVAKRVASKVVVDKQPAAMDKKEGTIKTVERKVSPKTGVVAAVKTTLSPAAAWPFPTGIRP